MLVVVGTTVITKVTFGPIEFGIATYDNFVQPIRATWTLANV